MTAEPNTPVETIGTGAIKVGVFDSGVGGLSVLRALRVALPRAELRYVADSGNAPYGEKGDDFVVARSLRIAQFLVDQGCGLIVVACNTATAAAVQALRTTYPDLPIVGIEPGIKPAAQATRNGRVGVMATAGTLRSERFQSLMRRHGGSSKVVTQACVGLAAAIEAGNLQSADVLALVKQHTAPLRAAEVDTVVLGCTHYPFVADLVAAEFPPHVKVIDTSEAVARQAARLAAACVDDADAQAGHMVLWSSGKPALLTHVASAWLGVDAEAQQLPPN